MKENSFPKLIIVRLVPHWFASSFHAGVTNQHLHISNSDLCFDGCLFSVADHWWCWLLLWLEHFYSLHCVLFIWFLKLYLKVEADFPNRNSSRLQKRRLCWCPVPGCSSLHRARCRPVPPCQSITRSSCCSSSSSSSSSRHKWPLHR